MDTHQTRARSLFELAYDTKPHLRYPKTVPSSHPSWWFDATVIVLCAVGATLYFTT
jgi:hypothetical protein